MNNLFDQLFEVTDSADSLDRFLYENMQSVNEFYNSNYNTISLFADSINEFIQFKHRIIAELNYEKSYAKSFILMLLDYCERFNLFGAIPHIYYIIDKHEIQVNSRMQAALLFLYPRPNQNSDFVAKFDAICEKLQLAVETEEDNDSKVLATFLSYYGIVINDTNLEFAEQVKAKILAAIQDETYNFLQNGNISEIANVDLQDLAIIYIQIQNIIDKILGKEDVVVYVSDEETEKPTQDFIIETDTNYSIELLSILNDFDSIRSISVRHAGTQKISGRGVKILESEEELFGYFKSFGNMHKAKLQSAFESLPDTFSSKVNIIDWGCGQGIASMIFIEKYGAEIINNIALIEPSEIAIKRASLHIKKYNPVISIKTVCKKLDDLTEQDLKKNSVDTTIHLFSNILDIDDYSQKHLIELITQTQSGKNYFVCVSPYIDAIKTERLESFERHFEKKDSFDLLLDITNTKSLNDVFWCCNNAYTQGCVNHGHYFNCNDFNECGCYNKWTRVIKVFSVDL
jgi:ribosomal protein L11 methylase PrmA